MKKIPFTRREFLRTGGRGLGMLAFCQYAPLFLTQSALAGAPKAEKDRTILVMVQLAGGNDGLNTLVPFQEPNYHAFRPNLALKEEDVLKVTDSVGLHQSCQPLHQLLGDGKLSIIQNVGYPNPNRSHFRSMEIWETGSDSDRYARTGWLGRFFDNACQGAPDGPVGIHVGNEVPQAFLSDKTHVIHGVGGGGRRQQQAAHDLLQQLTGAGHERGSNNGTFLQHTLMNALATDERVQTMMRRYPASVPYPRTNFAQNLSSISSLIAGGMETRVYFASLGGFDTHSNQATSHANLLRTLSEGLAAFQADLEKRNLDSQVLTMTFSEFGRRPIENDSAGTDHGTAAPLFVMGSQLKGGLYGGAPDFNIERNQDIAFSTDFRQVYGTVIERWLDCDAGPILGRKFDAVDFI